METDPIVVVGENAVMIVDRVAIGGCSFSGDRVESVLRPSSDRPFWRVTLRGGEVIEATDACMFLSPVSGGGV